MLMTRDAQLEAIKQAESAILDRIEEPLETDRLVRDIMRAGNLDEYSVRAAIWALIGSGLLRIDRSTKRVLLAKA